MIQQGIVEDLVSQIDQSIEVEGDRVKVVDVGRFRQRVHRLAEISALDVDPQRKMLARYLVRSAAQELGVFPATIAPLYFARGRGEIPPVFSVPAINLRVLAFDGAAAVFRAARELNAGPFIFEIARSEMGYTDQKPSEYVTSVLAAAVAEGYQGPVFIQGDHFQVSAKRFATDADGEVKAIQDLILESMAAGFFNIDIDASTMVDISRPTVPDQQRLNVELTYEFSRFIREHQPKGVLVSIGGEIGEVGGHNSTEEELRAFLDGYNERLHGWNSAAEGLSKVSIQTGTSHGGVVLPDGRIAQVSVDFDTMLRLSRVARFEYGLGGAVQHGASTLPEEAFSKFADAEAVEVHLATNFMNIFYERIPEALLTEIYAYLDKNHSNERKPDMTDEQFYYKTRKYAVGPFKKDSWGLPVEVRENIGHAWEEQFRQLFTSLAIKDNRKVVDDWIAPLEVKADLKDYQGEASGVEHVGGLAD
jgi:fructose/tagatose bisphosphate aldolase